MGQKEVVGFAGLGNMGTSMATNLLEFLSKLSPDDPFERQLHVHNRTQSKTDKLVSQGAVLAPSVADLASACTIVFSMLLNDAAVTSTVEAFLSADPKPGTVFVDCSTVYPNLSEDLSHKAAEKGVLYLTSPIFGRPDAVLAHRGLLVSAGDPAARERVRPLLEAIGQGILDCGDDPRAGSAMKLVGNFFISSWIELAAEGMTLGEKNGVARETVLDFITRLFPGFITTGTAPDCYRLSIPVLIPTLTACKEGVVRSQVLCQEISGPPEMATFGGIAHLYADGRLAANDHPTPASTQHMWAASLAGIVQVMIRRVLREGSSLSSLLCARTALYVMRPTLIK